jgi:transposase
VYKLGQKGASANPTVSSSTRNDQTMTRIAIDVAQEKLDVAVKISGKKHHKVFPNTKAGRNDLQRWLKSHGITVFELYMEATGRYWEALANWAYKLGWSIFVVNPRHIRRFAEAKFGYNKTDKIDAAAILRFAECSEEGENRLWEPKTDAQLQLRDIQMEISGLQKMINAERARLKCGLFSQSVQACIKRNIEYLKQQQKGLYAQARLIIKNDRTLTRQSKILKSQTGIGEKTAILLLAKLAYEKFEKGRQLVSMSGLGPVEFSSGKSVRKRQHISRVGHSDLRSGLYFPAVSAMTHDPEMREFKDRLAASGKCKKLIICAVMARMLRISFALIRENRFYERKTPIAA